MSSQRVVLESVTITGDSKARRTKQAFHHDGRKAQVVRARRALADHKVSSSANPGVGTHGVVPLRAPVNPVIHRSLHCNRILEQDGNGAGSSRCSLP